MIRSVFSYASAFDPAERSYAHEYGMRCSGEPANFLHGRDLRRPTSCPYA